jgi:hypothetical protein
VTEPIKVDLPDGTAEVSITLVQGLEISWFRPEPITGTLNTMSPT